MEEEIVDAQIKKGILEMCILYKLSRQDYYGYPLMQEMKEVFSEVNESTFYAILRRLHKEGKTSSYLGKESDGPQRKYYTISEEGRKSLQILINDWNTLKTKVKEIGIS